MGATAFLPSAMTVLQCAPMCSWAFCTFSLPRARLLFRSRVGMPEIEGDFQLRIRPGSRDAGPWGRGEHSTTTPSFQCFPPWTISSLHMHDRSAFGLVQNRAGTNICCEKCSRQPSSNRALIAGFCIQPRGICVCSGGVGYLPMDKGWFSFSSVPKDLTSAWPRSPGKSVGLPERDVSRIKTPFPLAAGWRRILRGSTRTTWGVCDGGLMLKIESAGTPQSRFGLPSRAREVSPYIHARGVGKQLTLKLSRSPLDPTWPRPRPSYLYCRSCLPCPKRPMEPLPI